MSKSPGDLPAAVTQSQLSIGGRRGGALIGGAAALSALCSLASQVLFERALGVQGFAQWAYFSSLLTILVPLACMGSGHILLSGLTADIVDRRGLGLLLIYFGTFTLLTLGAFVATAGMGTLRDLVTLPLALLVAVFFAQIPVVLVFPVFQRRGQTGWVAAWPLLQVGLRVIVAIAALAIGWTIFGAMVAWAVCCCLLTAVAIRETWRSFRRLMHRSHDPLDTALTLRKYLPKLYVSGIGFGLIDLFDAIDLKLMVPLAAFLFGSTEVAAAGLATVILSAVFFFPHVLITRVLLPAVHSESVQTGKALRSLVLRLSAMAAATLVPFSAAFAWFGFPILNSLVRGDYSSQEQAIMWLGVCWIPMCVSQLSAAPYMARQSTWRLFGWRVEALGLFILAALVLSKFGLLAIVIGFTIGRTWLCMRVLWALRLQSKAT